MAVKTLRRGSKVHINCIERFRDSDMFGQHVISAAVMWNKPGTKRTEPVARCDHGEEVKVVDFKKDQTTEGVMWYKIEANLEEGDKVRGWVSFPFIEEAVTEDGYGPEDH